MKLHIWLLAYIIGLFSCAAQAAEETKGEIAFDLFSPHLLARKSDGLHFYTYSGRELAEQVFPIFLEAEFSQPSYASTIQSFTMDGALYVLGRGKDGIKTYKIKAGEALFEIAGRNIFPDQDQEKVADRTYAYLPEYYSTIQAKVVGDAAYLIGRTKKGLKTYRLNASSVRWELVAQTEIFVNIDDRRIWSRPESYSTIQLIANGMALYLIARADDGIHTYLFTGKDWIEFAEVLTDLNDASGWGQEQFSSTIQVFFSNEDLFLAARGMSGLIVFKLGSGKWEKLDTQGGLPFADSTDARHYTTIQTFKSSGQVFFLGRSVSGVETFGFQNDHRSSFIDLSVVYGAEKLFPDHEGWGSEEYFSTIQVHEMGSHAYLFARSYHGLYLFRFNIDSGEWEKLAASSFLSNESSGDAQEVYRTIHVPNEAKRYRRWVMPRYVRTETHEDGLVLNRLSSWPKNWLEAQTQSWIYCPIINASLLKAGFESHHLGNLEDIRRSWQGVILKNGEDYFEQLTDRIADQLRTKEGTHFDGDNFSDGERDFHYDNHGHMEADAQEDFLGKYAQGNHPDPIIFRILGS